MADAEVEGQGGAPDELAEEGSDEGDEGIDHEPGDVAGGEVGEGTPEEAVFADGAVAQAREQGDGRPEDDVDIGEEVAVADVELVEPQLGGQDGLEVLLLGVGVFGEELLFAAVDDGGGGGDAGADGEDQLTHVLAASGRRWWDLRGGARPGSFARSGRSRAGAVR